MKGFEMEKVNYLPHMMNLANEQVQETIWELRWSIYLNELLLAERFQHC
jgi:hypothetical protein